MQALKAACNEAIGVLVSRTSHASAIWDRLLAVVVVAPSARDDPSTGRYDISYQLAEIEVSACPSNNNVIDYVRTARVAGCAASCHFCEGVVSEVIAGTLLHRRLF